MAINIETFLKEETDEIENVLLGNGVSLVLEYKHANIGSAGSHLDIADGYLEILYSIHKLIPYCQNIEISERWATYNLFVQAHIHFKADLLHSLTLELKKLSHFYVRDDDYLDGKTIDNLSDEIRDFEDSLSEYTPDFVDLAHLADNYLLNFTAGSYDLDPNFVAEMYVDFPERKHGFIRSTLSNLHKTNIYVSPWSWILDYSVNIDSVLYHAGFKDPLPTLTPATKLMSLVFNNMTIIKFPYDKINQAHECAKDLRLHPSNYLKDTNTQGEILLADDGHIMLFAAEKGRYLLFSDTLDQISLDQAEIYLEDISSRFSKLKTLIKGPSRIEIDWTQIDDERFEQICYDIVYNDTRFDRRTIRKMGKSRSRDGGRDIEVKEIARLGKPSQKWIIQCKFLNRDSSLSGSQVNISDVIDQYSVDGGFCVMTNGIIDSTLYDKLDAICQRRNIKKETWSKMEMERYLSVQTQIKDRYFT